MSFVPVAPANFRFREKRSEFIARLVPVPVPEKVPEGLRNLHREFINARHICWAYRVYHNDILVENSSDAGEPSGSAGRPILNQLRNREVLNCALFVIRHFGGIKLGKRGLMEAYGRAAAGALEQVKLIPWKKIRQLDVRADLKYYGDITKIIGKFKGRILADKSSAGLHLRLELDSEMTEEFCSEVNSVTIGEVEIKKSER